MILVIDNYDSFTYNLVHYLNELGAQTVVKRNDALTAPAALALKPQAILLSPGPCAPDQAGICLPLLRGAPEDLPILGVCLGHQAMGQAFGGKVVRAKTIMHGKTSLIRHEGKGVFGGMPQPFTDVGEATDAYVANLNTHPAYAGFRSERAAMRGGTSARPAENRPKAWCRLVRNAAMSSNPRTSSSVR